MSNCCGTKTRWTVWKSGLVGLLAGLAVVFAIPAQSFFHPSHLSTDNSPTGERWACAMMDYIGTKAGTCPVCGMDLKKVSLGELTLEQTKRMGVELATIVSGPAQVMVRAAGTAQYDDRFTKLVIPRVSGRIVERHKATAGCCTEVSANEPIVNLYSPEVFQAQNELQAAIKLSDQNLIASQIERFKRWNLLPIAEAIKAGKPPVDTITITTPFAGQVYLADFKMADEALMVGKEISADTPLLKLVDPDKLTLVLMVPESQANFLSEGQSVQVASDDRGPLVGVEARIARIGSEIDPNTRSVEVRIYLTGARKQIRPGSIVTARIHCALGQDGKPVADPDNKTLWGQFPLIPASAVLSTGVRNVAWKSRNVEGDNKQYFTIAPLALGPRIEDENGKDLYIVRAGLSPGDQVATQGAFLIDSQAQLAGSPSLLFPVGAAAPSPEHQH